MVVFNSTDFSVKTSKQKNDLRNKMEELAKLFVDFAKESSPGCSWDYYITKKSGYNDQWGAIYPKMVKGFEEYIAMWPNMFFNIPQEKEGRIMTLAVNIEFKNPREVLIDRCERQDINELVRKINLAKGAKIWLGRKEVSRYDSRLYKWTDKLWDDLDIPSIDTSKCNEQYLKNIAKTIMFQSKNTRPDSNFVYEPILLIKYEIDINDIISNSSIDKLFEDKVKLLSPILEHLIY